MASAYGNTPLCIRVNGEVVDIKPSDVTLQVDRKGDKMTGSIPPLSVVADGLAAAWEESLLALHEHGCDVRTEYDAKDASGEYIDPPSKDCTMMMSVMNPSSEPFIHRAFPGGLSDLEEYRQEVVDGIKDHWVEDGLEHDGARWPYSYHKRLTKYETERNAEYCFVDQIQDVVEKLAKSPISRRAQAITWDVSQDPLRGDPPCLQRFWFRILPDDQDVWHLNMNARYRSRDAYDAGFMNCFANIHVQEDVARRISKRAGREVRLGHYCDMSDSYHIYGRRLEHFRTGFLKQYESRSFEDRTWTREDCAEAFELAKPEIAAKVARQDMKEKEEIS